MHYAKIFLICFLFTIPFINCLMIHVDSEKYRVADCIENIIKATGYVTDLTFVNFKEINELTGLHKTPVRFLSRSFFWPNMFPNIFYIIQCDDLQQFQNGIQKLRNDFFFNPRVNFIIVVDHLDGHIQLVSGLLWKLNIFNVTVLTPSESGTDYEVYAFNPQSDVCGKPAITTLELVSQCSGLSGTENIFRYKIPETLKGCHVKIVTHDYWPFTSFNHTLGPGITQDVLSMWAEAEGINLEYVQYPINMDFGTVLKNFTFTGMVSLIESGDVDGAAGGYLVHYPRARAMDNTYPFLMDNSRVMVARAPFMNNWPAVLRQFSIPTTVIILLLIAFFCFAVVHFSIFEKKKKDTIRDIFIVFGYILGNICVNTHTMKKKSSLRMIVCCMLFSVFFITFMVQAYILSATTNPIRGYQINRLSEALSTCKPLRSPMWKRNFESTDPPECTASIICLHELMDRRNEKLYTAVSDLEYQTLSWQFLDSTGEPEVYQTMEPLALLMRTTLFERGTTLFRSYEKISQRIRFGGLQKKKLRDILFQSHFIKQRNMPKSREWLHQFREAFCVLLVGYSLAFIVFVFECRSFFYSKINIKK